MIEHELQRAITYWLDHPFRAVALYALAAFIGGFVRAAASDAARAIATRTRK
jgi:hypothetical protein